MKNNLSIAFLLSLVFILGAAENASANIISFIYDSSIPGFSGVDGNTSSWSTNNTMKTLGVSSWSLLDGNAQVTAYRGDGFGTLTHRGRRGLGIYGGENDEIDSYYPNEKLEVTFNAPYYLNYLEVRSLFYEPLIVPGGYEQGDVDFYLGGSKFYTQHVVGSEDILVSGTKGKVSFAYPSLVVDKLVFYVQSGQSYTSGSEFALAKLDVASTPEPATIDLFGLGLLGLLKLRRKRVV